MKKELSIQGMFYAVSSYLLWGTTPLFWKLLEQVPSMEILAHRILWSIPFLFLILLLTRKVSAFKNEIKQFTPKKWIGLVFAATLLLINWFTFIWAVNNGHIVDTSLGYYINPIVSVLLGVIILKESLKKPQWIAFSIVVFGVVLLVSTVHILPWISFTLAFSFGFYGLVKKQLKIKPITSLTIEMIIASVFSVLYLCLNTNIGTFTFSMSKINLLLVATGIVTALPLLLFNNGASKLPLFWMGILQYLAPTISLLIGIFVFREKFTSMHLLSFCVIWIGLIMFSISSFKLNKKIGKIT
ncbi:MAG: EamA family transporter RarD [Caldisericia bacterium]|nr:EamA family transporter RarD [Caldisericia bacterium]